MIQTLIAIFVGYGGILAASMAMGFVFKKPLQAFVIPAFLFLCVTVIQALQYSLVLGRISSFVFFDIPFVFAVAPLTYLFFDHMIKEKITILKNEWCYFLPALACLILIIWIHLQPDEYVIAMANQFSDWNLFRWLSIIEVIWLGFWFLKVVMKYPMVLSLKVEEALNKVLRLIMVILTLMWGLLLIGILFDKVIIISLGNCMTTVIVIVTFISNQRYPNMLQIITDEVRTQKYEKSQLIKIDLDQLELGINNALENDKLYQDEELSLAKLADILDVTPHQLSEYLNNVKRKSFKTLINEYRVTAARQMLKKRPELTVLGIGLSVGFNSSTTFHTIFKKFTGVSPNQYRQNS